MTNRTTNHDDGKSRQLPASSHFAEFKEYDSSPNPLLGYISGGAEASPRTDNTDHIHSDAAEPPKRVSQKLLEEIAATLSERDTKILSAVRHCRYLTTRQTQRLYFTNAATSGAGLRAANRNLHKLKGLGLAETLTRRIGGVRAGSGSLIWYLTQAGERLLRLSDKGAHTIRNFFEPSSYFLAHTLAVAECYVQLTEICGSRSLKLVKVEQETDCWRYYNHKGKITSLKPDLFAVTNCDDYEDRWFFEVDLKTEAPITIVEKCHRYHQYYQSGLEQKQHEVFPIVVWIVPDVIRKETIISYIRDEFKRYSKIFIVITPDELEKLIRQGVEKGELC